ncbi:disks large-associated protein 5 isoform X2 [Pristis pectinata]|uniref:disks large-associated protein 5 isoform X2 n=1 Tax=Pristis pectinata TaxID=685728 RepID=UPI00223E6A54|nr:disks large-associated protein 5 isoform X2 [Pristis pectinata]
MESRSSRFAERYKTVGLSVEALRVKCARRRSAAQKENRQRTFRRSRRFEPLLPPPAEEAGPSAEPCETSVSVQSSRLALLRRYKEEKALRKLKEERENPKRVFRVGVYKPDIIPFRDLKPLPPRVPPISKAKTSVPSSDLRVTRSMTKNQELRGTQPVGAPRFAAPKSGPVKAMAIKANSTDMLESRTQQQRGNQKAGTKGTTVGKKEDVKAAAVAPLQTRKQPEPKVLGPVPATKPLLRSKTKKPDKMLENSNSKPIAVKLKSDPCVEPYTKAIPEKEVQPQTSEILPNENDGDQLPLNAPVGVKKVEKKVSFAPENYVFAPGPGFEQFTFTPLSPRSVNNFFASHSWSPAKHQSKSNTDLVTQFAVEESKGNICESEVEPSTMPKEQTEEPDRTAYEVHISKPQQPFGYSSNDDSGPVHDVAYFRGVVASETQNLTLLCQQWDEWVNSEVVPDGVKDLLRSAVGQARLLMAERFKQFNGLVNNCEFKTSEKEVTCADLEGFWDMVYFQVEDVNKKFEHLKKIQENNWEEPSLPKRVVKKKATRSKPVEVMKVSAAPTSRLAAVKAAMKARMKQETADSSSKESQNDVIVFDAGFFRVESPAKSFPATPKTCCTNDWASRQRSKAQCSATRSSFCPSTIPASPALYVAGNPSQQTCDSFNTVTNTELPGMTNFISSMAREGAPQQGTCSGGSREQMEFEKYLQPRESTLSMPGALQSPFHNENDAKSSCTQKNSAHGIELPEEMKSSVDDCVEMASPVCERSSNGAQLISQEVFPLTNNSGLLTPNSVATTLKAPCSNSVGDLLAEGNAIHRMNEGNYMSPFETIREDHPVLPFQAALQDLISFSPSGTP